MAKECVYGDALTVQLPGEWVFLKCGAAQSVFYIFQQLMGMRRINQFRKIYFTVTSHNYSFNCYCLQSVLLWFSGLLLTRGLTNRLPVTLNIRDNPKGVHTEDRNMGSWWVSVTRHSNIATHVIMIEIHSHKSSSTPKREMPEYR